MKIRSEQCSRAHGLFATLDAPSENQAPSDRLKLAKEMLAKNELSVAAVSHKPVTQLAESTTNSQSQKEGRGEGIGKEFGNKKANEGSARRPKPPKKMIKYEVIGNNNVAVPTHLFKVRSVA